MSARSEQQKFADYVRRNIEGANQDAGFRELSQAWVRVGIRHDHVRNFT